MVPAPFGGIRLSASAGILVGIDVVPAHAVENDGAGPPWADGSLREAGEQMLRYLEEPVFDLVLPI